ncbi:alginate O-acetyltransferase complex protein AlgF [Pseudomonas sp. SJZ079]|uniref:alginate O-acetyltransferase AlgF n=1 Tax=Pseudomonas sp. SJZ079 TaxID=2572887 RepID=UPI0011992650|nr:alginate O-acetyltransferase AlgF [Pseudomonas sp. SJZ079]TWC36955.1 alginate O-acetyltransferase complex protein AlgF [Pseudomonas sp. SJZ079]
MNRPTLSRRFVHTGALLAGLLALNTSQAGDAALYAPIAPKGSAFVRLYNADNQEVSASLGSARIDAVAPLGSSAFSYLAKGDYSAQVGAQNLPVKLAGDQYYTLVNLPSGAPKLVEEPVFKSKQKALIRVHNLSDKALTLKTADGKTDVVERVAPAGRGDREINPVKVSLALFDGSRKVSDLKPVSLPRGEIVSLFITGSGDNLAPVWVKRPDAE